MGFFSWLFRRKPKPVKIGLALGSGGAKGFAELGALKAFEEHGIAFDVVGGTSIGSIIGAFYSAGYSSTDIVEMLKRLDVGEIASKFMVGMETSKLASVIERELGVKNIEELKKPFVCVATEMESGSERVFNAGSIAKALCASSCYPPFFKPVEIDGEKFIDGAFVNSVPADRVRELGADYVVAIDISNHETKSGLLSKFLPTYKLGVEKPWSQGYEYADLTLHPNLNEYRPISFNRAEEMFDIGYYHALEFIDKIKKGIDKIKKGK